MIKTIKKMYWGIQKHPVILNSIVVITTGFILFLLTKGFQKPTIIIGEKPEKVAIKSDFDLQAKCAKASEDFFERNKRASYSFEDYTNHYNKKLNKCFILVRGGNLGKDIVIKDKYLTEVLENKDIADWGYTLAKETSKVQEDCKFPDKADRCSCSESEFDSFVKPYMEE